MFSILAINNNKILPNSIIFCQTFSLSKISPKKPKSFKIKLKNQNKSNQQFQRITIRIRYSFKFGLLRQGGVKVFYPSPPCCCWKEKSDYDEANDFLMVFHRSRGAGGMEISFQNLLFIQCDQMAKLFFNIWPFTMVELCSH